MNNQETLESLKKITETEKNLLVLILDIQNSASSIFSQNERKQVLRLISKTMDTLSLTISIQSRMEEKLLMQTKQPKISSPKVGTSESLGKSVETESKPRLFNFKSDN